MIDETAANLSDDNTTEGTPKVAIDSNTDERNDELRKAAISSEVTEQEEDSTSLEGKSLEELVLFANEMLVLTPKAAADKLKAIKVVFYEKYNEAKNEAKELFEKENTDPEVHFKYEKANLTNQLTEIDAKVKQAREEEKLRVEQEKKKNLATKEELLVKLEEIVSNDETLESINQVKAIQREWKSIRVVPKEAVAGLWDRYNALQHKFYDNHGINIELKELDRQKNLELKIELTKKVEELHKEKSIKRCFILLNKLHEDFKNVGPVPQESREPIWLAFKSASDAVYEEKRKIYEELEKGKEANLENKVLLVEKAEVFNAVKPETIKDWNEKTKVFEDLFSEWKKIGPVPRSNKDAAWEKFNGIRNDFYTGRKAFFKEINAEKGTNLKAKEALCEKVEALADSKDWGATTKSILDAQTDWKKIGPVPEKVNQAIWKRFRSACDKFFNAKNEAFSGKREEEKENLVKKEALILSLTELSTKEVTHKEAFAELKQINAEWRAAGFVPHKDVKRISKSYDEANNAVYTKYSKQIEEAKEANLGEHYAAIKDSSPNGVKQLEREEFGIKKRMGGLRDEIASIERNMSFFAMSKTAEKMLKEFEVKIEKANKQISKLKVELGVIKKAKREDTAKKPDTSDEITSE